MFNDVLSRLAKGESPVNVCGLQGAADALLLARVSQIRKELICCIVPTEEQMGELAVDLKFFTDIPILTYPSFEIPPYTPLSPDPVTVATRLATLYHLLNPEPMILLASAEAILRKILPTTVLNRHCELVMAGEEIDREELVRHLLHSGYESCAMVQNPGDLSVRGGIIDIFAPPAEDTDGQSFAPLRLDFFGDFLESIRRFDPITQRSITELEEAVLLPASDLLFPTESGQRAGLAARVRDLAAKYDWPDGAAGELAEQLAGGVRFAGIEFFLPLLLPDNEPPQTLFDYLPTSTTLVMLDPPAIRQRVDLVTERIQANHQAALAADKAALPPEMLFLEVEELEEIIRKKNPLKIHTLPPGPDVKVHDFKTGSHTLLRQEIELQRKKRGPLAPLADRLLAWQDKGDRVVIACRNERQLRHLTELLKTYDLPTVDRQPPLFFKEHDKADPAVMLVDAPLSRGFDLALEKLHIVSTAELYGETRLAPGGRGKSVAPRGEPVRIEELVSGDIVVHRDHGLGLYHGLVNMQIGAVKGDYMHLEYKNGDKLYVPIDRLHLVSKYQGLSDQVPRLDRLGGTAWRAAKKKVSEAVWKVAQDLLQIYARRAMRKGRCFSKPGDLYRQLEDSFSYDETPGQRQAIDEVIADLTSEKPMDRLICGDVGYGKTEVAVRAAFKVIEDGFQAALLVPTTVLAEQHAATFRERFAGFPVEIACLDRFRSRSQQREILAALADGRLDMVIGTHRLLSKDVKFNRLGLLIIDEEHRFGVVHKEKLKKLRAEVDILTLTATPIPRTLQMSLLSIRDLSVISTPPRRRRAVKTFIARYDDLVIKEAVIKELQRGGQVFVVHNRVRTIHRVAGTIEKLVPQAKIGVAHGQMPGQALEEVMVSFINREIDVLVATTIIESGLDIPSANTIIINRADHLGLADIYQLRGRVGRSGVQAYAYLLVPSLESLSKDAKKRLRALMDASELGGGFKLAMNDLQIRGGGNLLGISQSGHITAVGYDLYLDLLQKTVSDLKRRAQEPEAKGQEQLPDIDPEINLLMPAYIPDDYIADATQRYNAYRRIAKAGGPTAGELSDLSEELEDRFGRLPRETINLLHIIGLKRDLRKLGIAKLEQSPGNLVFSITEKTPLRPEAVLDFIARWQKKKKSPARLTPDSRLVVGITSQEPEKILTIIKEVIRLLSEQPV